jgi:hypothetical protein
MSRSGAPPSTSAPAAPTALRTLATGLIALVVVSCGVETGAGTFREIPTEEIPFGLNETSTSTTTTSTTTTTSIPDAPTTTIDQTTTTVAQETVQVFFVSRDDLQPVPLVLPLNFGANQLAAVLEGGPPEGSAGVGLDTFVEEGLLEPGESVDGLIVIDLDKELFDEIATDDQTRAIGQIVLTFTQNLPRTGLVMFTLDGEPLRVTKGNGLLSDPDEALSFDDYASLIGGQLRNGPGNGGADPTDGSTTTTSANTTTTDPASPSATTSTSAP